MKSLSNYKERRKHPRISIDLPLEYCEPDGLSPRAGLMRNVSEMGLLLYSIKDMPVGAAMKISVFFCNGYGLDTFEVFSKIIWKGLHRTSDWKGYRYGLKFIAISGEDRLKLHQILDERLSLDELARRDEEILVRTHASGI